MMIDSVTASRAGIAGLTAAHELLRHGVRPGLSEKADKLGGVSRSERHEGFRFDLNGHRFFTKDPEVDHSYQRRQRTTWPSPSTVDCLQMIGRNGAHCYNHSDYSMRADLRAARNLLGEGDDPSGVKSEYSYGAESAPG